MLYKPYIRKKINKKDNKENNIKEKEDEDLLQKAQEKGLNALSVDEAGKTSSKQS